MTSGMDDNLRRELEELQSKQLLRNLRRLDSPQVPKAVIEGRPVLNFSSNDYLGLARHPLLQEAAIEATRRFGTGSGASRLVCGSLAIHHELEELIAESKGTEAALLFSTGYAAAVGTITALLGKGDYVVLDKLVHASIVDGARLSGATLRIFRHNDLDNLASILAWCRAQPESAQRRILVVTESVFSMDGDFAPLREIVSLKDRFGAWLMVDEAHATGLFGPGRKGRLEEEGLQQQVEIQMGTLGKAVGSSGGFITGSRPLIDILINAARSFIFSTAPSPALSGAAIAGWKLIVGGEGARRLEDFRNRLAQLRESFPDLSSAPEYSPILPLMVGAEADALALAAELFSLGFLIPAIRFPTVPRGKARLRLTCTAAHTPEDVGRVANALKLLRQPQA